MGGWALGERAVGPSKRGSGVVGGHVSHENPFRSSKVVQNGTRVGDYVLGSFQRGARGLTYLSRRAENYEAFVVAYTSTARREREEKRLGPVPFPRRSGALWSGRLGPGYTATCKTSDNSTPPLTHLGTDEEERKEKNEGTKNKRKSKR